MIILNFTHPLTETQKEQIEAMGGQPVTAVYPIPVQLDNRQPFAPQIAALLNAVPLTPEQWQVEPILINPPAYAPAVAVLLAQIHGRTGCFPAIIRIRPVPGSIPTRYEVAELINLQQLRNAARVNRQP
ncbi:MAG TPA: hypothetical protein EYP41_14610 [Anaerolineae bacterium]|nr:hypothetical protein [Anaerolineae bacterium]HIP71517.1 hypothetical protein [Anaerolineae bacterium]